MITDWMSLPSWVSHKEHWFVLTDTHGRLSPFESLLSQCPSGAKLLHLGDIGDRGPNSVECFELVDRTPELLLICGNHDLFIRDALLREDVTSTTRAIAGHLWAYNGGQDFLPQVEKSPSIQDCIRRVLARQKNYFQDGNLFFMHSGLLPEDDFSIVKDITEINFANLREHEIPLHLSWRGDDVFFSFDENTQWKGFPVKPFFIHGHRKANDALFGWNMSPAQKVFDVPAVDTWRIGIDRRNCMAALEIKDGMYRFFTEYYKG